MTYEEHLDWAKKRAVAYCDAGDVKQGWASMISDLRKHPETRDHGAIELGMTLFVAGHLSTPDKMKEFILGFN